MFRHHTLLTTFLTMATAIALFASGWILAAPAVADPRPGAAEEVVRAFYSAVNETIRTGDTNALETVMSEHASTHGPLETVAPNRAGLTHYLASLHANVPELELDIEELAVTGNRAVVDVKVTGAGEGSFLGSSLQDVQLWGKVDAFRVGNGHVLEFWSDATGLALLESQTSVPVFVEHPFTRAVTLDRLTIAAEERLQASGQDELRWLFGETDHITVTTTLNQADQATPTAAPISNETRLHAGNLLALPTWSETEVRNTGLETASLLVLTIAQPAVESTYYDQNPQSSSGPASTWPKWKTGVSRRLGGATITTLTPDINTELPLDQAVIAVAQVTLAPSALLADFQLSGPYLLVVDAGRLDLFAGDEQAWILQGPAHYLNDGRMEAGNGATLGPGAHAYLHNPGPDPAVVTLIAILPASAITGGSA
jgi:SnoaL-like polyketide cyclase